MQFQHFYKFFSCSGKWLSEWVTESLSHWVTESLIDWAIERLSDIATESLSDWAIEPLKYWVTELLMACDGLWWLVMACDGLRWLVILWSCDKFLLYLIFNCYSLSRNVGIPPVSIKDRPMLTHRAALLDLAPYGRLPTVSTLLNLVRETIFSFFSKVGGWK